LSLAEAATLAALPKTPVGYDPTRYPDRAQARRDLILCLMAQHGFITPQVAERTKQEPVETVEDGGLSAPAHYFVDAVRQTSERLCLRVASGGLRAYTTLDPAVDRAATDALVNGTAKVEQRKGYNHPTFAAAKDKRD